jgi:tetratricopeptide (TPR) repeat protein
MNRFLEEEVFTNETYKRFLSLISKELKPHYESEASYIERIRLDILFHMQNNETFDIFICYKKTVSTEKGYLETTESRQARNIKELLKQNGYDKVFFAEETLKGSPGANWEALIYTALKTSKVLLLMCSNDEYLRSAWVKNEWSRFYKLAEIDKSKKIIPVGVDGYNFQRLPFNLKKYQGLTMQDTTFSNYLINYLNDVIPVSIYEKVKRKQVDVVKERQIKDRKPVEVVSRRIGGKDVVEYKITPTVEKELTNIKKIYISRKRFSKAIKRYDNLLSQDEHIHEAIWGRICAKLAQTNFTLEELDLKADVTIIFEDFEQLMKFKKEEVEIYLFYLVNYFKRIVTARQFNIDLFSFILTWKEYTEQLKLCEDIYLMLLEIVKTIGDSDHFYIKKYVLLILEHTTRILSEDQNDIFFDRYLTIAEILLSKGYSTVAEKVMNIVLEIDELNSRALLIKLLLNLKVNDLNSLSNSITDKNFEIIFKKLLSSGYDSLDVHREILKGAHKLLDQNKTTKAIEVFDLFLSYYPEERNDDVRNVMKEFTNKLLLKKEFKLAEKYANHLLAINPKDSYAYYVKLRVKLKASSHLDVLFNSKEELMTYPEFENMLNSDEENEDALALYDAHDKLHEKTKEMKQFRKSIKKHYHVYSTYENTKDLKGFLEEVYPKILEDHQEISNQVKEYKTSLNRNNFLLFFGLVYTLFFIASTLLIFPLSSGNGTSYIVTSLIREMQKEPLFYAVLGLGGYTFIMTFKRNVKNKEYNIFKTVTQTITYILLLLIIVIVFASLPLFLPFNTVLNVKIIQIVFAITFSTLPALYALNKARKLNEDYPKLSFNEYYSGYKLKVILIIISTILISIIV